MSIFGIEGGTMNQEDVRLFRMAAGIIELVRTTPNDYDSLVRIAHTIKQHLKDEHRSAAEAMRERCRLIAEEEMDGYTKQSNPGYLEARNIAKRIDELPLDSDGEA